MSKLSPFDKKFVERERIRFQSLDVLKLQEELLIQRLIGGHTPLHIDDALTEAIEHVLIERILLG